jgi:hypothetical protein
MRAFLRLSPIFFALTYLAQADPVETIYVGPPGTFDEEPTNYTIGENWSPVGVPNNVAGSSYVVTIPEAVFVDIPITITSLTLNAAGSLTVKDTAGSAGLFIVGDTLDNSGLLWIYNSDFESHGAFDNFDTGSGTLTGGTYLIQGFDLSATTTRSSTFEFLNANIITNAASLTLTNHAQIVDQLGRDGLRNFDTNSASGTFVVGAGYTFASPGTFTNAGIVTIEAANPDVNGLPIDAGSFSVSSGRQYLHTSGATTVNGSLTADLTDIQAGSLSLGGMINGIVTIEDATFTPTGQSATVSGDLTLGPTSTFQFSIPTESTIVNGAFTSTGFDQLTVTGDVTLGNSALAVQVGAGFPISSHSTFTILTAGSALGGKFSNVSTGSRLTSLDGQGSFLVSLSGQTVQLSDFETEPPAAEFANLSTRGDVLTGDNILIGGFIIGGTASKNVILRALGPSLSNQGITNPLADPTLELHDSAGALVASNDNWKDTQQFAIESTGIPPTNDLESAIVTTLAPGAYTVLVKGNSGAVGTALVEVFDLSPNVDSTLSNLSTRGFVDGANPLIGGFIASVGTGNTSTVARAIGPDLANRGVATPLGDPMLEVRDVDGTLVDSNDDYVPGSDSVIDVEGLAPANSLESAIRLSLAPGNYTILVLAKAGDSGTALVELYDLYH